MLKRRMRIFFMGAEKYSGNDEEICKKIIGLCYNAKDNYLMTSVYSYPEFFSRDFGMCIESLINLGYKKKVEDTLRYAISIYKNNKDRRSKNSGITTIITSHGVPINFPDRYSPDSAAYFFRSLRIAKARDLIIDDLVFLNKEIRRFEDNVIDKKKGIVKDEWYSGMRDHAMIKSSCYDMIMACTLSQEVDLINKMFKKDVLDNTLHKYPLKKNLMKYYWTGKYFRESLTSDAITSHSNIFPYALGLFDDEKMIKSSMKAIHDARLNVPIPIKYGGEPRIVWYGFVAQGWEDKTSWTFIAMPYISLLAKIDLKNAKKNIKLFKSLIEKNKAFIELYDKDKPYKSFFYHADTSMLWACMYLDLKKKLKVL